MLIIVYALHVTVEIIRFTAHLPLMFVALKLERGVPNAILVMQHSL